MTARFTFRPVTGGGGPALCEVHRTSILVLGRAFYSQKEVESWAHGLSPNTDAMATEGHLAEVALDEKGEVVVFCSVRGDEVKALYVHPAAAGKGLGRALMERAEAVISGAGHEHARVEASQSGLGFYQRLGYVVQEAGDFPSRGGVMLKAFILTKPLVL
ncbi:MAG: GNAT family N-acetyltransferase [Alphaproteobacteria bacterium]|nr:GNAT family N-acetyltransferase [Rhodospirillaceae bacterium]MBT6510706.1 GNAT family N-acetyltransferase [Rhodospirillaceae bacterium]MBT7646334.1 GNAT family N-acetyltransferase [Rhodospirillaceae bacterium]MDG2482963.1 GNAT family N-acetyltransferase [Alphaproteobacteria bacterium]